MSDYATKDDIRALKDDINGLEGRLEKKIDASIDKAVNDLSEVIQQLAFSMSDQIKEVKTDIADIHASIDRLTNTIDKLVGRLDRLDQETAVQDRRFEKLLDWAREVSKKTGIPLKDL